MAHGDGQGFINESNGGTDTTYLNIYDRMLCKKRATPAPGFKEYEIKHSKKNLGKKYYAIKVTSVLGYLIGIKKEKRESLDKTSTYSVLIFTFRAAGEEKIAKLEVGIKSKFVAELAKRIETLDLFKPFEFGAFHANDKNKEIVFFNQHGEKVPSNFTKENPRDLPQWIDNEVTGEKDTTAYWTYLVKLLRDTASDKTLNEVKEMLAKSQDDFDADTETDDFTTADIEDSSLPDSDIPF